MCHLEKILRNFFFLTDPQTNEICKILCRSKCNGTHLSENKGKLIPTHINKAVYITAKHKKTILIIWSKMLCVAFFGDIIRTLLCLTAINMSVLICHSTAGWNALKLLYHAEAWRRATEFMDLSWICFMCAAFCFANHISSFSFELSCLKHCSTGLLLKQLSNGNASWM
jgi:hypothetical protein